MIYDLWDVELGKQLGSFESEAEALRLVRILLDAYDDDCADDLVLGTDDEHGPLLTGAALSDLAHRLADLPGPT